MSYGLPTVGADNGTWGQKLNDSITAVKATADQAASDAANALSQIAALPSGGGGGSVTAAGITDATATGRSVLTAASQAAARTAIGAGTSNLALGTTSSTAKAGNYAPSLADIPAGSVITIIWNGSAWKYAGATVTARPTARTDVTVNFIDPVGGATAPSWGITNDIFDQVVS